MKNLTFKVVSISFLISLSIFFVISYFSFLSYQTSMSRVLNIEKGIIGEFLPYKISAAMMNHESKETIQKMIDSNKRVFNIIITDCPLLSNECSNQKILFTQNNFNDTSLLKGESWFPLRNPPPLYSEKLLQNYKTGNFADKQTTNEGDVIGRVYVLERQDMKQRTLLNTLAFRINKWLERLKTGKFSNDAYMYDKNAGLSLLLFFIFCSLGWLQNKRTNEKLESTKSISRLREENSLLKNEQTQLSLNIASLQQYKEGQEEELRKLSLAKEGLIKEHETLIEKYNFILNYTMANKYLLESEFTAPLNNQIQKLNLIIEGLAKRVFYDTKDALHDINKAPILRDENIFLEQDIKILHDKLIKSRDTLQWTTDNIRKLTNLGIEKFNLKDELIDFFQKLPPMASADSIEISFTLDNDQPMFIVANPYHIRAIVKNVLYNSISALNDIKYIEYYSNPDEFKGNIAVSCGQFDSDYCYIQISDDAGGVPENFIENLYVSNEKVNPDSGKLEGNGSVIVNSYLSMYNAKVLKRNTENGFEVKFLFLINRDN
jgi:signal transduction histidine kinase|nr:hypothetical protein [Moraxella osloensis]